MSTESGKIETEQYQKLLDGKVALGAKIQEFIKSEGFLILKAVFYNFTQDVKNKNDYPTLEDFKADRKAIQTIDGLFNELDSMVNEAEQAEAQIKKLIESEGSTPSILSLDGEGTEDGQLSDF